MPNKATCSPWVDWVPGALNRRQVSQLSRLGLITTEGEHEIEIGACSIDLSLSARAFLMRNGSVKPSAETPYSTVLSDKTLATPLLQSREGSFLLEKGHTYVFKLRERLSNNLANAKIYGQATAKSSIGRVDVLARLIADHADTYESLDPGTLRRGSGELYLEITPITFDVKVRPGLQTSQLRLFYGSPKDSEIHGREICNTVLGPDANEPILTLNLAPVRIGGLEVSAFRARSDPRAGSVVRLWEKGTEIPWKYWSFVQCDKSQRIVIKPGKFYILRSSERLYVPSGVAIYCKASDETIGEMRIHYAGFVHPGFGTARRPDKGRGAPLIFEVRGHEVPANLCNGEKMANLVFYKMSTNDKEKSPYDRQTLKLSKIFKNWPLRLKCSKDGNVDPA